MNGVVVTVLDFDEVFNRVVGIEGGYVNDPQDPGGETKFGISKRSYPDVDIGALTVDGAKLIYRRDFWDPLVADRLPASVVYELFDFAVNSGIATAVRYLQRALGVADDGNFGPASKAAAAGCGEAALIMALVAERLDFMTRCKNWDHAGKGWTRRIARNLRFSASDIGNK